MDLPIQVMIVLFVTILIASAVIIFATDIIENAKQKMEQPWERDAPKEKVIEVGEITDNTMQALIGQCWKDHSQDALQKELCYVVHGASLYDPSHWTTTLDGIKVESIGQPSQTIFIHYNPNGHKIEVSS